MEKKNEEPVMGIPYNHNYQQQQYYVGNNAHQSEQIPPNAVVGDPKGIPLLQTIYRDTPAPINCAFCGTSGSHHRQVFLKPNPRSKPSLAGVVSCMTPFMLGVCFLCPSMDCLWHKYHDCPHCNEKLADFEKNDACVVMDPPSWCLPSFALPA